MIDDELLPSMAEPIRMRLKKGQGLFYADVQGMGEILCSSIEGRFAGITPPSLRATPIMLCSYKMKQTCIKCYLHPRQLS